MDLNDALNRVVLRNLPLIGGCVLAAVLLSVAMSMRGTAEYQSTARVSSGALAARSSQEAAAQAAQLEAVATSRSVVDRALTSAGVDRPPGRTARENVTVTPLGTSPVASVTVQDREARAAHALAQALADEVVVVLGRPRAALERQRHQLQRQIAELSAKRESQVSQVGSVLQPRVSAQLAGIDARLGSLGDRLVAVESLLGGTLDPVLLDRAGPATEMPSSKVPDAALAGLLGLVLGLGIAAVRESLRPTVVGVSALSKLFAAPALGTVDRRDGVRLGLSLDRLATRVDVAARRVDTNVVALTGPIPEEQLADMAQDLDYLLSGHTMSRPLADVPATRLEARLRGSANGHAAGPGRAGGVGAVTESPPEPAMWESVRVLPCDERTLSLLGRGDHRMGLLVVAPRSTPRDGLLHVEDVVGTTGWPLLGVVSVAARVKAPPGLGPLKKWVRGTVS
jgi:capsular polysaccharide biosynthesis protein